MKKINKNKKIKKLITHDGSFHADDVFACAALSLLLEKKKEDFEIIRTRDEQIIQTGDFIFDIGRIYDPKKNRFDHHQNDFKAKRKNGIFYSSFGLIWQKYGEEICGSQATQEHLDRMLVEQIDATDNGISIFTPKTKHLFNYDISAVVASFLPVWGEENYDERFTRAVAFARGILQKEIAQHAVFLKAQKMIEVAYKKSKDKRLVVLDTKVPRYLVDVASKEYKKLLFAIFPDDEHWKVLAVRKRAGSFENKKNLPKKWAGLSNNELAQVSGVADAIFCHRGLFIAVAKSKEGAFKLAQIALKTL